MFGSRKHHTNHSHTSHRQNRIRGLQASINNPRTTHAGRDSAEAQLHAMGARPNKTSIGTRIRHLFHLPGRSHSRNKHRPVHAY